MSQPRPVFRFAVDEYEKLIEHGILTERDNVELIRGELTCKDVRGNFDLACGKWLLKVFGPDIFDRASQCA